MRTAVVALLLLSACGSSRDGYYAAAWSPDGKLLAIGTGESVRLEDAETRDLVAELRTRWTVHGVEFTADGSCLVFGGKGNTFSLVPLDDGGPSVSHPEVNPVVSFSAAVSRDGKTILSAGADESVLVWQAPFDEPVRALSGAGKLWQFAITPDGTRAVATATSGHVTVWDVASGQMLRRSKAHDGYIFALAMSPDGQRFATGGSADDTIVRIWSTKTLREKTKRIFGTVVRTLAFSPDGRRLAVGGNRRILTLYDARTGKVTGTIADLPDWPSALAFSPHGDQLLVTVARGRAMIYKVPQ
ncbi:MAG: WD40 repeat domain-containing protein [Planctomycetota bacterium]|jgi:DNA-binding beta-propeller fold protein YncE